MDLTTKIREHLHEVGGVSGGKTAITYGSVCSGIEAATTAWHPLGWIPRWFAEIEPFPSAVLAHHWPQVPNLGDFTLIRDQITAEKIDAPDVLVGGTPCQAFSVAGLRQSMDDARGQLTLEFVRLADAIDATRSILGLPECIVVWENVPGVLNTTDNAFGCFLAGLAGEDDSLIPPGGRWSNAGRVLGPSRAVAWRILDAQYFGVAQRRRRVFVVASARDGFDPTEILFEFDGVRRDSPPRRETGEGSSADVVPSLTSSGRGVARAGETRGQDPVVATCATGDVFHTLRAEGHDASEDGSGRGVGAVAIGFNARQDPDSWDGRIGPLDTDGGTQAVAVVSNSLYIEGINHEGQNASSQEADPREVLQLLQKEVGAEAFAQWGLGILDSLQSPEILRQALHGFGVRPAAFSRSWVVYCALSCPEDGPSWLLQSLREVECAGCPPQGWEPSEQLANELRAYLSKLSQPGAQATRFLRDLWEATEGIGVLREALSKVQAVGRRVDGKKEPAQPSLQVRRLTCKEAERLQGFPDGHTRIPWPVKRDLGQAQCAKQVVRATVCTPRGMHFVATNHVAHVPVGGCPRAGMPTGLGYDLCRSVCGQEGHAEVNALRLAGTKARGSTLYLEGHTYLCDGCRRAADEAGIVDVVIGPPPTEECPDGPRYKSLGNSMAVPVMQWIGARIDRLLATARAGA